MAKKYKVGAERALVPFRAKAKVTLKGNAEYKRVMLEKRHVIRAHRADPGNAELLIKKQALSAKVREMVDEEAIRLQVGK